MNQQLPDIMKICDHAPILFGKVDDSTVTLCIVGAVVLIVVVAVGAFIGNRFAKKWRFESHQSLFSNLCKVHGLNRKERKMLKLVGQGLKVPHLSLLIADPKWIDRAIVNKSFASNLTALKKLRSRFFSTPEEKKATSKKAKQKT